MDIIEAYVLVFKEIVSKHHSQHSGDLYIELVEDKEDSVKYKVVGPWLKYWNENNEIYLISDRYRGTRFEIATSYDKTPPLSVPAFDFHRILNLLDLYF